MGAYFWMGASAFFQGSYEYRLLPKIGEGYRISKNTRGRGTDARNDQGVQHVVCHVNELGLKLIEDLNGRESIRALAGKLHKGFNPAYLEHTEASVASLPGDVGTGGTAVSPLLRQPLR